jgi:hypothetical protein
VPQPPAPCPPVFGGDARIAAPVPPAPACDRRAVIATVNRANVLYARALRTLDTRELPQVWADGALEMVRGFVVYLRNSGLYATPELRSITLEELRVSGGRATVRTLENWLYQERSRFNGQITYQANQWVANVYELELRGRGWVVYFNSAQEVPAPLPPPPPPPPCIAIYPPPPGCEQPPLPPFFHATISADRPAYRVGETIVGTITNISTMNVYGGGGYRCGMLDLEYEEWWGWAPAPGGAEVCPAIAHVLEPNESRQEWFTAPGRPGRYRLSARLSSDVGSETFYSAEFSVIW